LERKRERKPHRLGFRRRFSSEGGSGMVDGGNAEAPGDGGGLDEVKKWTASPGVWSMTAVVSCRRAGG
jgi:hypothetical protein